VEVLKVVEVEEVHQVIQALGVTGQVQLAAHLVVVVETAHQKVNK